MKSILLIIFSYYVRVAVTLAPEKSNSTRSQPTLSLILQFEEGLYKKIGDVYSCKNVSFLTKEGDQFNTRVQIGFSSIYVDRYIFDISYNSRYVTRIDLSDYLSLEDQIKTFKINMIPNQLAFQSDDPDYVYVMGEGECDNSGNRTVYAINFSPIHCFENETWCLGEHYRKVVTKLSCSHTLSSITLLNSLYPYLLFDDQPMTKQINCYRADRYYDQPIACLSQEFPVNRSNLVTYPKSEYKMYLQVKYFDNHTKADRYNAFVVDTSTGECTELSRDETHTHCPMVGPQVYSCPHYTVIGQDLPFSPVTQPQVYMFQGERLITYGTAKGVFLRSPKFPSGVILDDSENFCKDLTHSSPIVILDSGKRIVVIMCTNGQYSMQIYLLYEDRYIIIRSIDKDCLSLTEGGKQSLLNIFSPGEVHFLPVHVNVSKNDTDKELPPPDSHYDEIVILITCTVLVSIFVFVLVCMPTLAILVIVYCKKHKYQMYNLVTARRGKNRSVLASRQTMSSNPLISKVEDPEIDTLPPDGNRSTKQSHRQASNPHKQDHSPRLICASDSDSEVNNEECQPIPNESNLTQDASPVASPSPQFAVSKVLVTSARIQKNRSEGFKQSTKPKPQPTPVATGGNITASTAGKEMDKENDNDEKEELVAPLRVKTFASANQSSENSSHTIENVNADLPAAEETSERLSLVGSDSVEDKTAVTIKFPLTPPIRDQIQPPNVQPPNVQPSNGQPPNGQPPNVAVPVDQSIVIFENVNNEPLEETSEINGYQSLIVMGHELNPLQFGRNNFSNPDGKN